jgi:hypothetical protein
MDELAMAELRLPRERLGRRIYEAPATSCEIGQLGNDAEQKKRQNKRHWNAEEQKRKHD